MEVIETISSSSDSSPNREDDYKPHLTAFIKKLVQDGDTVVDIGAATGYHTLVLAEAVGSGGMVYAFEPHPENADVLEERLTREVMDNVRVYKFGLAHKDMTTCICNAEYAGDRNLRDCFISRHYERHVKDDMKIEDYIGMAGEVLPLTKTMVRCMPLDSLPVFGRVSFVNIGVQGFEKMVITGGAETIVKHRPVIAVECEDPCMRLYSYGTEDLFALIRTMNYEIYMLNHSYPSDHICVPEEGVEAFERSYAGYIFPHTEDNETNHNLIHGVTKRIVVYEEEID